MIKAGQSYLMLKIATPMDFSFEDEHKKIIDKDGYVWFCRFGKGNLKIESISELGNILFVKESVKNGGKRYMMEFSEISSSQPTSGYPDYYNTSDAPKDIWF